MRSLLILLFSCHNAKVPAAAPAQASAPAEPAVIFLVRHAEKASTASDATLTEDGVARAALLARTLADVDLVAVHSTDTVRTRATAEPTAADHGLTVALYETTADLVDGILTERGAHLVVGHSNTVPSIVSALDPSAATTPIAETEYDRLYLVVQNDAGASTVLMRYGTAPE